MTTPSDPLALLRSRSYVALLVLAAVIGVPVSAAAYFFLALVSKLQEWIFTDLPKGLGFHAEPLWWPVPPLLLAGLLVAVAIRYLPGKGGHSPADGFKAGAGPPAPIELPGIVLAAFATLCLGVVLGPEAPRSEEHTSELQSPCNLVCRLLLEKKKKITFLTLHIKKKIQTITK